MQSHSTRPRSSPHRVRRKVDLRMPTTSRKNPGSYGSPGQTNGLSGKWFSTTTKNKVQSPAFTSASKVQRVSASSVRVSLLGGRAAAETVYRKHDAIHTKGALWIILGFTAAVLLQQAHASSCANRYILKGVQFPCSAQIFDTMIEKIRENIGKETMDPEGIQSKMYKAWKDTIKEIKAKQGVGLNQEQESFCSRWDVKTFKRKKDLSSTKTPVRDWRKSTQRSPLNGKAFQQIRMNTNKLINAMNDPLKTPYKLNIDMSSIHVSPPTVSRGRDKNQHQIVQRSRTVEMKQLEKVPIRGRKQKVSCPKGTKVPVEMIDIGRLCEPENRPAADAVNSFDVLSAHQDRQRRREWEASVASQQEALRDIVGPNTMSYALCGRGQDPKSPNLKAEVNTRRRALTERLRVAELKHGITEEESTVAAGR